MKYKIRDLQFQERYYNDGLIFTSKKQILDELVSYHSIDFADCEAEYNGKVYDEIFEYVQDAFKNDKERLNFILAYGEWEIEEDFNF